jgi:hypothetical protein
MKDYVLNLTVNLELSEGEARLLFSYVEENMINVPEAIRDLLVIGLTLGVYETERREIIAQQTAAASVTEPLTVTGDLPPWDIASPTQEDARSFVPSDPQ